MHINSQKNLLLDSYYGKKLWFLFENNKIVLPQYSPCIILLWYKNLNIG